MLLLPITGFIYFGTEYGYLYDKYVKYFVVIVLIYIFVGFHLLRKVFDGIDQLSTVVRDEIHNKTADGAVDENQNYHTSEY